MDLLLFLFELFLFQLLFFQNKVLDLFFSLQKSKVFSNSVLALPDHFTRIFFSNSLKQFFSINPIAIFNIFAS